jgi:hypothetical protein
LTADPDRGRPAVFARLRREAERRLEPRQPGPGVRWVGWAIALALLALVVVLALQAGH